LKLFSTETGSKPITISRNGIFNKDVIISETKKRIFVEHHFWDGENLSTSEIECIDFSGKQIWKATLPKGIYYRASMAIDEDEKFIALTCINYKQNAYTIVLSTEGNIILKEEMEPVGNYFNTFGVIEGEKKLLVNSTVNRLYFINLEYTPPVVEKIVPVIDSMLSRIPSAIIYKSGLLFTHYQLNDAFEPTDPELVFWEMNTKKMTKFKIDDNIDPIILRERNQLLFGFYPKESDYSSEKDNLDFLNISIK
jgi:hypothetical protein